MKQIITENLTVIMVMVKVEMIILTSAIIITTMITQKTFAKFNKRLPGRFLQNAKAL